MKLERKEIADLLRSYKRNVKITDIKTYKTLDYQLIGLTFKDSFNPPNEATAINLHSFKGETTRISFGIQFKPK